MPAYMTKDYADLTDAEREEFDNDAAEAAAAHDATRGPEFPYGEFAPQCNIGPLS
jgi:hypothetical protein